MAEAATSAEAPRVGLFGTCLVDLFRPGVSATPWAPIGPSPESSRKNTNEGLSAITSRASPGCSASHARIVGSETSSSLSAPRSTRARPMLT